MTSRPIDDLGQYENALRHGQFRLRDGGDGVHRVELEGLTLTSAFTPLFSRAHGRAVGHRARLQVLRDGQMLPAAAAASALEQSGQTIQALALEPALHMTNYRHAPGDRGWLAIPVPDGVAAAPSLWPPLPQDLFSSDLYAPHDLVLEVSASSLSNDQLADFAGFHRELGFLVALTDFGVREADLKAVWAAAPELVEVPMGALRDLASPQRVVRMLDALARMLHESGAMVALVGVDDESSLALGLETAADLFCGEALRGRHEPLPPPSHAAAGPEDAAMRALREKVADCADRIAAGEIFESACEHLLAEPGVMRCYLLDGSGTQLTENLARVSGRSDPRFWPLANAVGGSWAHRDYFVTALDHPGQVMRTGPYLSVPDGRHCITLAVAVTNGDETLVLCCDTTDGGVSQDDQSPS